MWLLGDESAEMQCFEFATEFNAAQRVTAAGEGSED